MFPLLPSVRPIMKEYALMFVVAFVSATILPAQSEAVLVALVADGDQSPWALVDVATVWARPPTGGSACLPTDSCTPAGFPCLPPDSSRRNAGITSTAAGPFF